MRKAIINFIKRLCAFQIIAAKTTLKSIEIMEDIEGMQKGFKDKLDKANEKR